MMEELVMNQMIDWACIDKGEKVECPLCKCLTLQRNNKKICCTNCGVEIDSRSRQQDELIVVRRKAGAV